MKSLLYTFFVLLLLQSCTDDTVTPAPLLYHYERAYMIDLHGASRLGPPQAYALAYDAKARPSERRFEINFSMYPGKPTDSGIHDTLIYQGNTVRILTRSRNPELFIFETDAFIQLRKAGQPEYRILKYSDGKMVDSTRYYYHASGKIDSLVFYEFNPYGYRRKKATKRFVFDSQGNLQQVVTSNYYSNGYLSSVMTEKFGDYDTAPNPLRALYLFNDTYYRSLSANNFQSYRQQVYVTSEDSTYMGNHATWPLLYDAKGVPVFYRY